MSAASGAPQRVVRVLFLCTRNSARSQIAEALFLDATCGAAGSQPASMFEVASAGADPSISVDPMTFEVLDELGIDWRAQAPKGFDAVMGARWDVVITLCDGAREACPDLPGHPLFAHWPLDDPCETPGPPAARRHAFLQTAARLRRCIVALLGVLDTRDSPVETVLPAEPLARLAGRHRTERRIAAIGGAPEAITARGAVPSAPHGRRPHNSHPDGSSDPDALRLDL